MGGGERSGPPEWNRPHFQARPLVASGWRGRDWPGNMVECPRQPPKAARINPPRSHAFFNESVKAGCGECARGLAIKVHKNQASSEAAPVNQVEACRGTGARWQSFRLPGKLLLRRLAGR